VIAAFVISFSILFYFTLNFDEATVKKNQFYQSHKIKDEKLIFLIGSSHMGQLNTTHIQKVLDKDGHNYTIYNLAFAGDKPEKRISEIDKILELEPEMIVYGLGYRDFSHYSSNRDNILPDLHDEFHSFGQKMVLGYNLPSNPKFVTLNTIQDVIRTTERLDSSQSQNRPFFDDDANLSEIKNNDEIIQNFKENDNSHKFDVRKNVNNINFIALQKILDKLNNQNIDTVIYVTPHHPLFIQAIEENGKTNFEIILKLLEDENMVYNFEEKYNDKEIWADLTHIAYNEKSLEFSEDMAKIIIDNIDS